MMATWSAVDSTVGSSARIFFLRSTARDRSFSISSAIFSSIFFMAASSFCSALATIRVASPGFSANQSRCDSLPSEKDSCSPTGSLS